MQEDVAGQKARMRETMKARRDALHDGGGAPAQAAATFAGEVLALAPPQRGEATEAVVSSYLPIGSEIDPQPLMRALAEQGAIGALPVIVAKARPLTFRSYLDGDPLEEKLWGIREPLANQAVCVPDILVLPMLAFDDQGWRLGYGGGFYDRTLAGLRAEKAVIAIGLAYDGQRVDAVPYDDYDARLDFVLTPSGLRKLQG